MVLQHIDTTGRDDQDVVAARSLASALRESSPRNVAIASLGAVTALACAVSSAVPLAAALPVALLVIPCLVDLLDRRLPNRMLLVAAIAGLVAAAVTLLRGGEIDLRSATLGTLAFAGPLLVMHVVAPGSMGFGDVKIAVILGAAVGVIDPVYGLLSLAVGSLLGAAAGLIGRRRTIAFGPALVGGALTSLVLVASSIDIVERTPQIVIEGSSEVTTP